MTIDPKRLIFIHGLYSSSQSTKAILLRSLFPGMLTPDFPGSLEERMEILYSKLGNTSGWKIIGSSFGGLMGTLFTNQHPEQVEKLILLAPALVWPDFAASPPEPIEVPTVIYQGLNDEVVPIDAVRKIAEKIFLNLSFNAVDDDHRLHKTVHLIDWKKILA